MICPYCGSQNEEGAAFCGECGSRMPETPVSPVQAPAEEATVTPVEPPVPEQPEPAPVQLPAYAAPVPEHPPVYAAPAPEQPARPIPVARPAEPVATPATEALRRVFSSPVYLIGIIALVAGALMTLLGAIITPSAPFIRIEIENFVIDLQPAGLGSAISGFFGTSLTVFALVFTFVVAVMKNREKFSTVGLMILKVLATVALVCMCIGAVAFVAAFVLFYLFLRGVIPDSFLSFIKFSDKAESDEFWRIITELKAIDGVYLIIAAVVVTAILVFMIFVLALYIKTLGAAIRVAKTGKPSRKASAALAVMFFIIAAAILGTALFMLIGGMIFAGISTCCTALAYVAFALTVLKFRSEMKAVAPAQNAVAAPAAPQFAPAAPQYAPAAPRGEAVICPRCGASYPAAAPSCPVCGLPRQ